MGANYQAISKCYGLLDTIYFRDNGRNPRRAMLTLIPDGQPRVLELCTGTGVNVALIAAHRPQARVVGIDLSGAMLDIARDRLKAGGLDRVELAEMDATQTGFDRGSFDVVLISLVLHEIDGALAERMLSEARRVLAPEGRLIVIEWEAPRRPLPKLLFSVIRMLEPSGFGRFLGMDMRAYFAGHGFAVASEAHCDYSRVFALKAD